MMTNYHETVFWGNLECLAKPSCVDGMYQEDQLSPIEQSRTGCAERALPLQQAHVMLEKNSSDRCV